MTGSDDRTATDPNKVDAIKLSLMLAWKPNEIGGRRGGAEVYRAEAIELRAGDRVRWTRNDKVSGLDRKDILRFFP